MTKFYAVKKGYKTGVFTSWSECLKNVSGYSGAIYKSFKTKEEAENFIIDPILTNAKPIFKKQVITNNNNINTKNIFTDGSCKKKVGGYAIVYNGDDLEIISGFVPYRPCTNNIAELFAIKRAIENYKSDIIINTDSEYSINVLTGNKNYTKNVELIDEIKDLLKDSNIEFNHVEAHTGIYENELCDKEAKKIVDEYLSKM